MLTRKKKHGSMSQKIRTFFNCESKSWPSLHQWHMCGSNSICIRMLHREALVGTQTWKAITIEGEEGMKKARSVHLCCPFASGKKTAKAHLYNMYETPLLIIIRLFNGFSIRNMFERWTAWHRVLSQTAMKEVCSTRARRKEQNVIVSSWCFWSLSMLRSNLLCSVGVR